MFEAPKRQLKVSREGIVLIKSFEGFRPRAQRRDPASPDGGWIIGYGHTLSAREGATVSETDAELLLQYDLLPIVRAINASVGGAVNQHQFDALVSFVFSVGVDRFRASDVLQRLKAGAATEAADALYGWPEPVAAAPSLRRRAAERALFVADPAAAVALSDLLTAPLPSVALPSAPAPEPDHAGASAPERLVHDAAFVIVDDTTSMDAEPGEASAAEASPETAAPELAQPADAAQPGLDAPVFAPVGLAFQTAVSDPGRAMIQQRYMAYGGPVVGPLPGLAIAEAARAPTTISAAVLDALTPDAVAPIETLAQADEVLVLTPFADDQAVAAPRAVWSHDETAPTADQAPLFQADEAPSPPAGPIVRHEQVEDPVRFQWGQTGAYAIMGAFGLVSFGMSMAAFRLASQQDAGVDETTLIAWVLAAVGGACVGVSAFNLYRSWGRADA